MSEAATQSTYGSALAITPSDTTQVAFSAIYVGGAGDVVVTMEAGGTAVTFKAPPVGTILPVRVVKVNAATTATLLIGLS